MDKLTRKAGKIFLSTMLGVWATGVAADPLNPEPMAASGAREAYELEQIACRDGLILFFGENSVDLSNAGRLALDEVAPRLIHHITKGGAVTLEGHADVRGRERENDRLSGERALSVAEYLSQQWHVRPTDLIIHAWGARDLQSLGEDGSERNRRVELFVPCDVSMQQVTLVSNWHLNLDDFGGGEVPEVLR